MKCTQALGEMLSSDKDTLRFTSREDLEFLYVGNLFSLFSYNLILVSDGQHNDSTFIYIRK